MGLDVAGIIALMLTLIGVGVTIGGLTFAAVRKLGGELKGELKELRSELGGVRDELRGEITAVRDKLDLEVAGLRGEIAETRQAMSDRVVRLEDSVFGVSVQDPTADTA